nr:MAG TPA: hypothetical protein [Caudoviricetes sp.]DAX59836.1 MAG TPA: hypothetical protein [Caudoviricetes sp.]
MNKKITGKKYHGCCPVRLTESLRNTELDFIPLFKVEFHLLFLLFL